MADNVDLTSPAGTAAADEVSDGTLGTVKAQYVKLMDGTLGGTDKAKVAAASTKAAAADPALVVAISPNGVGVYGNTYETVAASATAQVLGAGSGATGDYIAGVLVVPATTSPGNVLLIDNATSITIFTGGATSVSNLVPFYIPLGMVSQSGAWKLTTGANVSAIGMGKFT